MGRSQEGANDSQAAKTRRTHKKSRRGCTECKRRHIRCDEGRPACTNCNIAERACSFLDAAAEPQPQQALPTPPTVHQPTLQQPQQQQQQSYPHSPAESSKSGGFVSSGGTGHGMLPGIRQEVKDEAPTPRQMPPAHQQPQHHQQHHQHQQQQQQQSLPSFNDAFANTPTSSTWSSSQAVPPRVSTFTPQHLMLLHHAETAMDSDILWHGYTPAIVDIAIRYAVDCPYLIDELLAFAAIHLAREKPATASTWRHHATELQTRAVASFAKDSENPESEVTYNVPRFLFATMLSLHVLAETLEYYRSDLDVFIDRYIECVQLHKGIRTVIQPSWPELLESELKPLLHIVTSQRPQDPTVGEECRPLHALIDACPQGSYLAADSAARAGCHEAVRMLQWAFDLVTRLPQPGLPHGVSGFSIMIPAEFTDVLRRHVPEALVVMAYFGVLLHRTRRYWVCGNNGAFVIRGIADRLGPQWEEAMRWPLRVLVEEHD